MNRVRRSIANRQLNDKLNIRSERYHDETNVKSTSALHGHFRVGAVVGQSSGSSARDRERRITRGRRGCAHRRSKWAMKISSGAIAKERGFCVQQRITRGRRG